jgi:hypothetical protein
MSRWCEFRSADFPVCCIADILVGSPVINLYSAREILPHKCGGPVAGGTPHLCGRDRVSDVLSVVYLMVSSVCRRENLRYGRLENLRHAKQTRCEH